MLSEEQVPAIIKLVNEQLKEADQNGVHLQIFDHSMDDGWLYIVVNPSRPGVRASDHAEYMSIVEKKLHEQGIEQVLLVPTLENV